MADRPSPLRLVTDIRMGQLIRARLDWEARPSDPWCSAAYHVALGGFEDLGVQPMQMHAAINDARRRGATIGFRWVGRPAERVDIPGTTGLEVPDAVQAAVLEVTAIRPAPPPRERPTIRSGPHTHPGAAAGGAASARDKEAS